MIEDSLYGLQICLQGALTFKLWMWSSILTSQKTQRRIFTEYVPWVHWNCSNISKWIRNPLEPFADGLFFIHVDQAMCLPVLEGSESRVLCWFLCLILSYKGHRWGDLEGLAILDWQWIWSLMKTVLTCIFSNLSWWVEGL